MPETTFAGGTGKEASATQLRSFGDLLREYRVAAGLTQEALAERARMSLAAIGKLERGTRQKPYRATIGLLADALTLSANERLELERAAHRSAPAVSESVQHIKAAINLPVHLSSFVGRDRELANVCEMLATQRLVTLAGAGGVGKTRLAIHAAERFVTALSADRHLDGLWFADLSAALDRQTATAAIATSVGMEQCRSLDALLGYLRSQRSLLILDNCEQLIDDIAQIANGILCGCPHTQILATSRQALGLDGERISRVPPLSLPMADIDARLSLSEALEFGAIRLFTDRAEAADSRFELTQSMIPTVAKICRRLDGIALAIELAAARTNAFPLATIAQRLDQRFLVFTGGTHASLPRHKTMRVVFDWSYDLLDDSERSVFRRLSVFVDGFTLELATSLCSGETEESDIFEILASLVDKSLVQCDVSVDPARYRLLEPARQYAREKLRERGEENVTARSHALALLALAEGFDSRLEMVPDREWDAYVGRERENFRAAFEWSLGPAGDVNVAQRLAGSRTAMWCGLASGEIQNWISAALKTSDDSTPPRVRAKLALISARTAVTFGNDTEAELTAANRALDVQDADDLPGLASAQFVLGRALQDKRCFGEAETAFREALATARSCGVQSEYAFATKQLAEVRAQAGDLGEAQKLISEALRQYHAAGCDRHAANAKVTLAEIEFATGYVEKALELAEDAAEFFRAHKDWLRLSLSLGSAGSYLLALKRYREARSHAREALLHARAVGQSRHIWWIVQQIAAIAILRSDGDGNNQLVERATNLMGFVNELLRQRDLTRDFKEHQEYEKAVFSLREMFEEGELKRLMAVGKEWSEEQAVAEALAI